MNLKELDRIKIGERIKSRRNLLNMSREELADRLDLSANLYLMLNTGIKEFPLKLCTA